MSSLNVPAPIKVSDFMFRKATSPCEARCVVDQLDILSVIFFWDNHLQIFGETYIGYNLTKGDSSQKVTYLFGMFSHESQTKFLYVHIALSLQWRISNLMTSRFFFENFPFFDFHLCWRDIRELNQRRRRRQRERQTQM